MNSIVRIDSVTNRDGIPGERTAEHEWREWQAAAMGAAYPEPTRTLRVTLDGIRYEILDAIISWQAPVDGALHCLLCGDNLRLIAPKHLYERPVASCACSSSFLFSVGAAEPASIS
jgi:hypothetical protein